MRGDIEKVRYMNKSIRSLTIFQAGNKPSFPDLAIFSDYPAGRTTLGSAKDPCRFQGKHHHYDCIVPP